MNDMNRLMFCMRYLSCLVSALCIHVAADGTDRSGFEIEKNGNVVFCSLYGRPFAFPVEEFWPVCAALDDGGDPELGEWNKDVRRYVRKYAPDSRFLFSIPGIVAVCQAERVDAVRMTPEVTSVSVWNPYSTVIDTVFYRFRSNDKYPNHPNRVFRSLKKDVPTRSDIVIDRIYLNDDDMLVLIYPVDGREHYAVDSSGCRSYSHRGTASWDIRREKIFSLQYVRRVCGAVAYSIIRTKSGGI